MINKLLKLIFGDKSEKDIKEITPYVDKTLAEYAKLSSISNDELRAKTSQFKQKIRDYIKVEQDVIAETKKKADNPSTPFTEKEALFTEIERLEKEVDKKTEEILLEILPEAFAVIKETARRLSENGQIDVTATDLDKTYAAKYPHILIEGNKAIWKNTWDAAGTEVVWNMVHYNVQLIGGTAMHMGKIAEMSTGEGKTLVATLPVYLNALTGKGVHIVTVNDYLAKRDSEWMGPLYQFHGLTVDCIDKHQPNTEERRRAYNADITFGTNNEFGFDYLRDNMVGSVDQMVQRKHHYAIIDEVDSVLIDDARTPLIISGPTPDGDKHEFHELKPKIQRLVDAQRKVVTTFLTEAKKNLFALNGDDNGKSKKEISTMLDEGGIALLRAYRGLPKNKALIKYLSESGIKAHLQKTENFYMQDQSKEMHKIDKELYFVIDEKNNQIELTEKGIDLISGNEDPSFYIMPDIGSEMAEIERSSASSEEKLKRKDALMRDYTIKAERIHSINQLLKAYTLFEADVEYVIMDNKIKIVDEQTGRIMDGRRYSDGLHQAIEAKENVTVEAATQTYATVTLQNYFRMYHKLSGMTGTAETEAKEFWDIYKLDVVTIPTNRPISRKDHDDLVYKTGREKYNAVIDEIEKLVKQGRPVLVGTTSVEISELLSRMLKMKKISHNVLNAKLHQKEAEIVAEAGKPGTVTIATNMAGRGTDIKLGEGVKEAGGLAIIGTERHDSRRVDRQLRGRAGRQGDPGSSQFFVSLGR
jgi:preprotein translocase subunit SecA